MYYPQKVTNKMGPTAIVPGTPVGEAAEIPDGHAAVEAGEAVVPADLAVGVDGSQTSLAVGGFPSKENLQIAV